jgi:hypothetical protein
VRWWCAVVCGGHVCRASGLEEEARELRTRVQAAEAAKTLAEQETERAKGDVEGVQHELTHAQSQLGTATSERERLAIETAEQKDALAAKQAASDALSKQLSEATEQLASATATASARQVQIDELSRSKHEIEVEYRSYQEHNSTSNQEQLNAIGELKITVDRLSDQVEKKQVENTQAHGSIAQQASSMAMLEVRAHSHQSCTPTNRALPPIVHSHQSRTPTKRALHERERRSSSGAPRWRWLMTARRDALCGMRSADQASRGSALPPCRASCKSRRRCAVRCTTRSKSSRATSASSAACARLRRTSARPAQRERTRRRLGSSSPAHCSATCSLFVARDLSPQLTPVC